jgi:membrane associated rhomboid family serine protease
MMDDSNHEVGRATTPIFTYGIIALIVVIQLYLSVLPLEKSLIFFETYALIPVRLFDGIYLDSVLTYIFLHGNWVHLLVNCIALFGAGVLVEREIGHLRFLIIFLASGIAAGLLHSYMASSSSIPLIGSSGATFGVIAVLFLLMPFKITYVLVVPLPSVVVGLMLSVMEIISLWMANDVVVAHDVHITGFLVGCVGAFFIDRKRALAGLIVAVLILLIVYYLVEYLGIMYFSLNLKIL